MIRAGPLPDARVTPELVKQFADIKVGNCGTVANTCGYKVGTTFMPSY